MASSKVQETGHTIPSSRLATIGLHKTKIRLDAGSVYTHMSTYRHIHAQHTHNTHTHKAMTWRDNKFVKILSTIFIVADAVTVPRYVS